MVNLIFCNLKKIQDQIRHYSIFILLLIISNSVFANDEDSKIEFFGLAPMTLKAPNFKFRSNRDSLFRETYEIPPDELYPLIFSEVDDGFTSFVNQESESSQERKDYNESKFRELLRLSSELFSETPLFKDVGLLLATIGHGNPLFEINELNYFNVSSWLHIPFESQEEAIKIFKLRFVKAFLSLLTRSDELKEFIKTLNAIAQKTPGAGQNQSVKKPLNHWTIDAMARQKANVLVPEARNNPRQFQAEYDRVYHHWYLRYQSSFEDHRVAGNLVPSSIKPDLQSILKLETLALKMLGKHLNWEDPFEIKRLNLETLNIDYVAPFSAYNDPHLQVSRVGLHAEGKKINQKKRDELADKKVYINAEDSILIHPSFDPNYIYFVSAKNYSPFSRFYLTDGFLKLNSNNPSVTNLSTEEILTLFAASGIFMELRYLKYYGKFNSSKILNSIHNPSKLAEALAEEFLMATGRSTTNTMLTGSIMVRIFGESIDPLYWQKRDEWAEAQGLPSVVEVLKSRYTAWGKKYLILGKSSKDRIDSDIRSLPDNDLKFSDSVEQVLDFSAFIQDTNLLNLVESPVFKVTSRSGVVPTHVDVFRSHEIESGRFKPWIPYHGTDHLNQSLNLVSLKAFKVKEMTLTIPTPRGYELSELILTDKGKVLENYTIFEDPLSKQIYIKFNEPGYISRWFFEPIKAPETVTIKAKYIPTNHTNVASQRLLKEINYLPRNQLIRLVEVLKDSGLTLISNNIVELLGDRNSLSLQEIVKIVSISSYYELNWQKAPEPKDKNRFTRFSRFIQNGQFCGLCYTSAELGKEILDFLFEGRANVETKIQETFLRVDNPSIFSSPGHAELRISVNKVPVVFLDFTASGKKHSPFRLSTYARNLSPTLAKLRSQLKTEMAIHITSLKKLLLENGDVVRLLGMSERQIQSHPLIRTLRLILLIDDMFTSNSVDVSDQLKTVLFNETNITPNDIKDLVERITDDVQAMNRTYNIYGRPEMDISENESLIYQALNATVQSLNYISFNISEHQSASLSGSSICERYLGN